MGINPSNNSGYNESGFGQETIDEQKDIVTRVMRKNESDEKVDNASEVEVKVEQVGNIGYLSYLPAEDPVGFEESAHAIRQALVEASTSDKEEMRIVAILKKNVYQPMHHFMKENATDTPFYVGATRAVIQLGMDKLVAGVDKAAAIKGAEGTVERQAYDEYVKDAYYIVLNLSEYAIDDDAKLFLKKYEEEWKQEVDNQYYQGETDSSDYKFTDNKTADIAISVGICVAIAVVIEVICICFGFYLTWPIIPITSALYLPIKKAVGKRKTNSEK